MNKYNTLDKCYKDIYSLAVGLLIKYRNNPKIEPWELLEIWDEKRCKIDAKYKMISETNDKPARNPLVPPRKTMPPPPPDPPQLKWPTKDSVISEGFRIANNSDYDYRNVLRDQDNDIYYSGWMDCFDWISKVIDLDELERKLDEALNNETPESLKQWLQSKRSNER